MLILSIYQPSPTEEGDHVQLFLQRLISASNYNQLKP